MSADSSVGNSFLCLVALRSTLFDYPPAIRKVIYTTNAIESLNSVIKLSQLPCQERAICGYWLSQRSPKAASAC